MISIFTYLVGSAITFPFLLTFILYLIAKQLYKSKRKAVHFCVNYSTIFYILSVGAILHVLFGQTFFGFMLILLLILLSISIIIQWKIKGEIIVRNAWKVFWRFTFLLFFIGQAALVLLGIGIKLVNV